ncbi:fungal-specific transcription factor domain-containing protein [Peziza echinospora]|nr:fungal-specific transcription factor domain-containing protein [Peziza echinospora]
MQQQNYVFVDEHNRHKRLKVMRACEGCRRRKIKCDAATTNTWPCSACVRLKLHCVPPTVQYDRDLTTGQKGHDQNNGVEYQDDSSGSGDEEYLQQTPHTIQRKRSNISGASFNNRPSPDYRNLSPSEHHSPSGPTGIQYSHISQNGSPGNSLEPNMPTIQQFHTVPGYPAHSVRHTDQWADDNYTAAAANVSGVLEQLKIEDDGVANYISLQSRRLAETPAYEPWADDYEENPSFVPGTHEFAVRIPIQDMPSEEEAADLFDIYFRDVHPYLPIVNKSSLLRQWNSSRESISPLLLETIFATAGRISPEPTTGLKWISMATRHVDCFMDVPRLSTVQALLLLLKARESAPQRGYFFRSWMSIVSIIAMAKDLGLDRHHSLHINGMSCGESQVDCQTKTRVWQACFTCELMISAPQGRSLMQIDPESVDLQLPIRTQDMDEQETTIYRNFVYFVYLIKNIRRMNDIHAKLKANPGWRSDPEFTDCGPILDNWARALPTNLHVIVPTDLSIPCPPVEHHYVANLQIYHNLARIMVHRPPLAITKTFTSQGQWKEHMSICSNAAKNICRLTEVVWRQFGMPGLKCMMRGINFTIYANLTATMIHLIAATCPDPLFNSDAKDYFTRSMRILENCIGISASSETKGQIQALREAFSLDLNRPFELNPAFPFSQPIHDPHLSRQAMSAYSQGEVNEPLISSSQVSFPPHPLSPPHSTGECDSKGGSPSAVQSLVMLHAGQRVNVTQSQPPQPMIDTTSLDWNPSRIFDSWNNAIAGINGTVSTVPQRLHTANYQGQAPIISPPRTRTGLRAPANSFAPANINTVTQTFVSPGMWQDSVAAVYADTRKPFQFGTGDGGVWTTASPGLLHTPALMNPITIHSHGGRVSH